MDFRWLSQDYRGVFGSSDVTLANGCCEYDLLDDRIIFNGGKRKLTADRKLKKQARKPHK